MKKLLNVGLTVMLLCALTFALVGCGSEGGTENNGAANKLSFDGIETTYTYGNQVFTVSVPKNDAGEAKYAFTEEMPESAFLDGSFYLDTDNAVFVFSEEGLAYNTSLDYKDKYGETDATFDGYVEWVKDPDSHINLEGLEELDINDRSAIRYCIVAGSDVYEYFGYRYCVSLDDVASGSNLEMNVLYKNDEALTSPEELDRETLDIISSLTITANN